MAWSLLYSGGIQINQKNNQSRLGFFKLRKRHHLSSVAEMLKIWHLTARRILLPYGQYFLARIRQGCANSNYDASFLSTEDSKWS